MAAFDSKPTMAETDDKPTLHHMNDSQSQRILWLLEELGIPYNLTLHSRQTSGPKKGRSPPELYETHPMGKAPQLVTASGRVIAESSAIAAYLLQTYDTSNPPKFHASPFSSSSSSSSSPSTNPNSNPNDWIRDESLTNFAGASLGPILIVKLLLALLELQTPFLLRPLIRLLTSGIDRVFTGPELAAMLAYLEAELGSQPYFMGETAPGRADFMLSFPLDMVVAWGWADALRAYPGLRAWRARCQAREAWKRSLEKGNGYDVAFAKKG